MSQLRLADGSYYVPLAFAQGIDDYPCPEFDKNRLGLMTEFVNKEYCDSSCMGEGCSKKKSCEAYKLNSKGW